MASTFGPLSEFASESVLLMASIHRTRVASLNVRDQQIAAKGPSIPQDAFAILLHRLVRRDVADLLRKEFLILVVVADPVPEERVVL